MSSFYVTLPSNTKVEMNTNAAFRCPLAHSISLEGNWEVAMAEIQYPRSWYNLSYAFIKFSVFDWRDRSLTSTKLLEYRQNLENANITSVEEAVAEVEKNMKLFWIELREEFFATVRKDGSEVDINWANTVAKRLEHANRNTGISFNGDRVELKIDGKAFVNVDFAPSLRYLLGFRTNNFGVASHAPKLDGHINSLYIYTNIIAHQLVGDVKVPVLRVVPARGAHGEVVDIDYPNMHYVDVLSKDLDSIEIYIRGEDGRLIPFNDDRKVVVKLHFRKKRNL